ncbi:MAG: putative cytosol aminopeptidase [Nitrospinaceae bacterium]|nr:MAG: putative cytosol aminopeptidase [Nitrospinaceae bacterium]
MIKTTVKTDNLLQHKTPCLVLFCPEEKKPAGDLKQIDQALNGSVAQAFKDKRFEGKPNQALLLNARGAMKPDNLLLVGIGKAKEVTEENIRQASGTAAKVAEGAKFKTLSYYLPDGALEKALTRDRKKSSSEAARAVAEGSYLALYHFDIYKSKEKDETPSRVEEIILLTDSRSAVGKLKQASEVAGKVADGVWQVRDLILEPSNKLTPSILANTAKKMAAKQKISCKVLREAEMKKLGMGSLLGVSKGSSEPPAFIILEYKGGKKNEAPIAIVGKAVTFDTGGISLKPAPNMDEMKKDMSGGAVTLGTLQVAASLKLPINLVGLIPSVENMPDGAAIKPGDILTSMSGKTIEVLNTDAEGRLILADALSYAARFKPKAVIDLATLTGAVIVALGSYAAGVMGTDDELIENLKASGTLTGEKLWQLPLWDEHDKETKSDIADLKNIASAGVGAGTTMGAAFLKPFAGDQPWAHIDIAGTSWTGKDKAYTPRGASGFGVRLLVNFLEQQSQGKKTKSSKKRGK